MLSYQKLSTGALVAHTGCSTNLITLPITDYRLPRCNTSTSSDTLNTVHSLFQKKTDTRLTVLYKCTLYSTLFTFLQQETLTEISSTGGA